MQPKVKESPTASEGFEFHPVGAALDHASVLYSIISQSHGLKSDVQ
jgi:hypothetical protein